MWETGSCIGMPNDELKWPSLGKGSKILLRVRNSLDVRRLQKRGRRDARRIS